MKNKIKITTIFVATTLALTPTSAYAMGDGMFNWPTGWPADTAKQEQKLEYGAAVDLKAFVPKTDKKKQKKKQ